jgi:hypothetical protein
MQWIEFRHSPSVSISMTFTSETYELRTSIEHCEVKGDSNREIVMASNCLKYMDDS